MPTMILDFDEIDELFLEYKKANKLQNNAQFKSTQKSKIIEALWRNLKTKSIYVKIEEFPDEMVKVANYCLKVFLEKDSHHGFARYIVTAIKNRISTCMQNNSFDENTKGMHVSDKYRIVQNKLRRLYKSFISLRKSEDSENELNKKFIDYASNYLEIDRHIVIDFLEPQKTTQLDNYSENDEESFDISDLLGGSEIYSPSEEIENQEKNEAIFFKINKKWKSQKEDSKPVMSELLTLVILDAIDKGYILTSNTSEDNICERLKQYDFVSKELISKFFLECKIILPSQQEIGEKYGLSKSGVSKKISRFFEKIDFSEK